MASVPRAQYGQIVLPSSGTVTQIIEIPSGVEVGTLSVRILNAGQVVAPVTLWVVPAGTGEPSDQHLIENDYPLKPSATALTFSVAVSAGLRIFAKSSGARVVAFANSLNHHQA